MVRKVGPSRVEDSSNSSESLDSSSKGESTRGLFEARSSLDSDKLEVIQPGYVSNEAGGLPDADDREDLQPGRVGYEERFAKKSFGDFCGDCYKTTSWVEAYSGNIFPVGHPSEWTIPEGVRSMVVYPPLFRAQAGRPKKKRYKSAGEHRNGNTRHCTICGKSGHNRQNCRNAQPCQIPVPSATSATSATIATSKRPRRPYRCRKCGEEGHNSQKCPLTPEVGGTT
ncbi:hypothetical protein LWI29_009182 [Acer saccharum]|uniref:CCHC-type domain-containing protein n=1 Tax=Acer saccharum TaxID=4024 RepID=A0AA39VDW3_ACESA|nr:hypothetical protein LWI29_009182 [Acer saccharum]